MTQVAFHFNVPDRLGYAGRLLRKAARAGSRLAVVGPLGDIEQLDRLLWVSEPLDFVPHLRLTARQRPAAHLLDTPIWLVDDLSDAKAEPARLTMLLTLAHAVPEGIEHFERIFEVISTEPAELGPARQRWRHYQSLGMEIIRHDLAQLSAG